MTVKIMLSAIGDLVAFKALVDDHAAELRQYAEHVAAVKMGEAQGYPPPVANELVDRAVRRPDLVPDFEVVDDVTPPPLSLEEKKQRLHARIRQLESEAMSRDMPVGKRRLLSLKLREALETPENARTDDETSIVSSHEDLAKRDRALQRRAAEMQAVVDDLTAEDIDSFEPNFEDLP